MNKIISFELKRLENMLFRKRKNYTKLGKIEAKSDTTVIVSTSHMKSSEIKECTPKMPTNIEEGKYLRPGSRRRAYCHHELIGDIKKFQYMLVMDNMRRSGMI